MPKAGWLPQLGVSACAVAAGAVAAAGASARDRTAAVPYAFATTLAAALLAQRLGCALHGPGGCTIRGDPQHAGALAVLRLALAAQAALAWWL